MREENHRLSSTGTPIDSIDHENALEMRYSPSYTGLRLILRGIDPAALETAFRRHASRSRSRPRLTV
jgi:hypothetical protein